MVSAKIVLAEMARFGYAGIFTNQEYATVVKKLNHYLFGRDFDAEPHAAAADILQQMGKAALPFALEAGQRIAKKIATRINDRRERKGKRPFGVPNASSCQLSQFLRDYDNYMTYEGPMAVTMATNSHFPALPSSIEKTAVGLEIHSEK